MKHTKRIVTTALAALMAVGTAGSLVACGGKKVANDADTLEIYVANFGYGYDWVNSAIELFKKQDWVQEKYPNLNIPKIKYNSERSFTTDRVLAGANANTIDLFFSCATSASAYFTNDSSGKSYFEDLTDLYNTEVPGEGVLYKDKMIDEYNEEAYVEKLDGSYAYYSVPWVNGYFGILYNKDLVESTLGADYELPKTTEEFAQMAEDIKEKEKVPFISASNVNYWVDNMRTWWIQYEGFDAEQRYWEGVNVLGNRTWENIKQTGRLRSLEVIEQLIGHKSGNNHSYVNTLEFTQAQARFLLGEAFIMPNGDWFENEMRATEAENPYDYDIRFMKTPIVSAVVEKLSFYTEGKDVSFNTLDTAKKKAYDEKLSFLVGCVDEGKDEATTIADFATAGYGALTSADYKKVKEARSVQMKVFNHEANIPSYATAKAAAKDFLLFLATDEACEDFARVTGGVSSPFEYDMQTKAPDLYNSISNLHKSRLEVTAGGRNIRSHITYRLAYLGGLTTIHSASSVELLFTAKTAEDRMSAKQIYEGDIKYFEKDNGANWISILVKAGYQ